MHQAQEINSNTQRWITGVFIGLPVLACLAVGPVWSWCLLVASAITVGLWELRRLIFHEELTIKWSILYFAAGLLMPLGTYAWGLAGLNALLFLCMLAAFSIMLATSPLEPGEIPKIAMLTLAWLYIPYLLSFALLVGTAPQGRFWILYVVAVIISGDAGAYHTGLKIGRHKLYELVSPKKTVEGALGGLFSSVLIGSVLGLLFLKQVNLPVLLVFSFCIAITGQVGDLIESMLKRNFGKKDSSHLLPGHGGILDRLDSLLFAFPVMWALLQWAGLDN